MMLAATIVAASWLIQLANGSPTWWYNLGAIDSTKQAEDSSIATIGQVKHMAVKAKSHLDGSLSGGAGSAVNSLISSFAAPSASDSQVVQLGQLKYVASKFYDRLNAVGYPLNYTQHPQGYPWTSTTSDDANSSPALLGQVKEVFGFDLTGWTGSGGGTGGGPGAGAQIQDTDGDGINDKFEISIGLNPNVKDSDGDGTDDGDEDNDGDGLIDRNDPAPNNPLIDWPKTGIPRYAVVDIPTGGIDPGAIQDVNSKGEVLFAKHYWRPGDPGLTALGHATGSIQLKAFFNQGQEAQNLTAQPDPGQFWALSIGDGGKIAGVGVWEGTTVGGNHPGANREATRGIYWNTGASSVGTLVADDIDVYHSWIDGVNASELFVRASRYNQWANKQ
ncbi:MAG: thrombospondin type 3 repeat-containing protein [Verrucomicrobiales bacterium]